MPAFPVICHRRIVSYASYAHFPLVVSPATRLFAAPPLSPIPAPLLSPITHRPACFLYRLSAVRAVSSSRNVHRIAPATSSPFAPRVLVRRLHMLMYIAFGRCIVASSRDAPSPHRRPCLIAARIWRRLDLLVAWLREGRGGEAWHTRSERIGTAPDSAGRICPIPYRMPVPAGHRGSGYPILILLRHGKWAGCGMRVETSIGCDIEHAGISRSPPKFHPM